jgi:hypothetical protein
MPPPAVAAEARVVVVEAPEVVAEAEAAEAADRP